MNQKNILMIAPYADMYLMALQIIEKYNYPIHVIQGSMETLESAMSIVDGEDHVTLFTCTPYGVNTHRLLVRGVRVPYEGEEDVAATPTETMVRAVQDYYMLYLVLGLSVTLLIIVILRCLIRPKRRKNAGGGQADSGKR